MIDGTENEDGTFMLNPGVEIHQPIYRDKGGNEFIFAYESEVFPTREGALAHAERGGLMSVNPIVGIVLFGMGFRPIKDRVASYVTKPNGAVPVNHFAMAIETRKGHGILEAALIAGPDYDELLKGHEDPAYEPKVTEGRELPKAEPDLASMQPRGSA